MYKSFSVMFAAILLLMCFGCTDNSVGTDKDQIKSADLVLLNGYITTVDPDIGNVSAMAINDYKITAVGNDEEIKRT